MKLCDQNQIIMKLCSRGTSSIIAHLEEGFYRFGLIVASRPWTVIFTSFCITLICSLGLLNLKFETDANKIWGPDTSVYIKNNQWLSDNFPQNERIQTLIFRSSIDGNILSPESLKWMLRVHRKLSSIAVQNITFESICRR